LKLAKGLVDLSRQLGEAGFPFALVGGIAASARGEARFTRDIDVAVAVQDDAEAERVVFLLVKQGYVVTATVEQEVTGRLATARLRNANGIICDLIFATTGIESEIVQGAELIEVFSKVHVPTATAEALLAMKTLSATPQRPRDSGDIQSIILANQTFDEAKVLRYLDAINRSGCARGQQLEQKWLRLRTELGV
jgi:hypothetical protein